METARALLENSLIGPITLEANDEAILSIFIGRTDDPLEAHPTPLLKRALEQLCAYFAGELQSFDLPLRPQGTDFQKRVYQAMLTIPYGKTQTYGDIAKACGTVPRAVGGACGSNPIPIVIPCHRVLGSGKRLVGFSGGEGVLTKERLLRLESPQYEIV